MANFETLHSALLVRISRGKDALATNQAKRADLESSLRAAVAAWTEKIQEAEAEEKLLKQRLEWDEELLGQATPQLSSAEIAKAKKAADKAAEAEAAAAAKVQKAAEKAAEAEAAAAAKAQKAAATALDEDAAATQLNLLATAGSGAAKTSGEKRPAADAAPGGTVGKRNRIPTPKVADGPVRKPVPPPPVPPPQRSTAADDDSSRWCTRCGKNRPGDGDTCRWKPGPLGSHTLCWSCGVKWAKLERPPHWGLPFKDRVPQSGYVDDDEEEDEEEEEEQEEQREPPKLGRGVSALGLFAV